mgnify:FL=1
MPIKTLAILSVLASTALPVSMLCLHAYQESQIPDCNSDLPATTVTCSERITGMKYTPAEYRRIYS